MKDSIKEKITLFHSYCETYEIFSGVMCSFVDENNTDG